MTDVLLFALNSSYFHTNLAVRCIVKSLSESGFNADFIEFNLKDRRTKMLSALVESGAGIYGFSAYIWNISELLSLAEDLKKLKPEAVIIFGGPEVSYDCDEFISQNRFIDYVISGEGEDAFADLVGSISEGRKMPAVIYGGEYAGFEKQGMVYSSLKLPEGGALIYYESSRGCPYRCAYCLSSLSGRVRMKSAEVTLSELLEFESFDAEIKVIKFVDRTFNADRERAKKIWRGLLSDRFTKRYHFEICAELLDEKSFEILEAFPEGKIQLEIGVQSTNKQTLAAVSRHSDTDRLLKALERIYSMGNIHVHADLIAGLPGEGMESFQRSFDAVYGKCHLLQLGFLKLLKGSELRRNADSFGCVYEGRPPYTVLATDSLSFSDICKLHVIDELLERYSGAAFLRSLRFAVGNCRSPFLFFDRLADRFIETGIQISSVSQPRAYSLFYEFCGGGDELALALNLDFLTTQKANPPKFGDFDFPKDNGSEAAVLKRRFAEYAKREGISYFLPSLEVRRCHETYLIDREGGRVYLWQESDTFKMLNC